MTTLLYSDAVRYLKTAVRVQDAALTKLALDYFKANNVTSREAYRIALAGDPSLTWDEWTDLLARAGVQLP
jgi:hypothetical protein